MDLDKMLGSGNVLSKGVRRVLVRAAVRAAVMGAGRETAQLCRRGCVVLGSRVLFGAAVLLTPLVIFSMNLVGQACCSWQGRMETGFWPLCSWLICQSLCFATISSSHLLLLLQAWNDSPGTAYKELVPQARLLCVLCKIIKLSAAFPRTGLTSVHENSAEVQEYVTGLQKHHPKCVTSGS